MQPRPRSASGAGTSICFPDWQPYRQRDNKILVLDVAPYIYQNRTYIPLRFLAEQLSARVEWNAFLPGQ
jgi:hypothetical protein